MPTVAGTLWRSAESVKQREARKPHSTQCRIAVMAVLGRRTDDARRATSLPMGARSNPRLGVCPRRFLVTARAKTRSGGFAKWAPTKPWWPSPMVPIVASCRSKEATSGASSARPCSQCCLRPCSPRRVTRIAPPGPTNPGCQPRLRTALTSGVLGFPLFSLANKNQGSRNTGFKQSVIAYFFK